jgi:hypothetical protein
MARRERDDDPDRSLDLDAEGIPDLEGPAPGKLETGDPQEGLYPPRDVPVAALDHGTTAREQAEGLSLDDRLAREEPELSEREVFDAEREEPYVGQLLDADLDDMAPALDDDEADLVGRAVAADPATLSAEEAAVHELRED